MADIPPILVQIQADVANLKSGLAQAEASLKGLDTSVGKTNSVFEGFGAKLKTLGATIGITFAATQVVSFFKQSVAAAQEAEAVQTRLRTILLNTNGATMEQVKALNQQAEALEKVGVVTKENVTMTQSQLATFDLQGKTIETLTPAILDYVTAEKGATASTDDFRSMTNGLAQALNGNFASLTRQGFVLTDNQKKLLTTGSESERAAALTDILNSTYKDFNKTLANTPEGRMIKLKNEFGSLKEEIGKGLLPVFEKVMEILSKTVIPALKKLLEFVKDNSTELKVFIGVLGLGAVAWGLYTIAIKKAIIQERIFKAVMATNPIGLIITAVALLVAGMVKLFKSNETFRNAVISMAKVALNAFASIIPIVARVYEAIGKIVTGPMRLFLLALSKLPGVGKYAQSALDGINKGLDGISDFGDAASKKAKELAANLDKLGKEADKAKDKVDKVKEDVWKGSKDPAGDALSKADQKKLDKTLQQVKKLQEDIAKVYKDAEDKRLEALDKYNERIADAQERYDERLIDLEERKNESIKDAQERFRETTQDNLERYIERVLSATEDYKEKIKDIEETYNERIADILETFNEKKIQIQEQYDKSISDLQQRRDKAQENATERHTETVLKIYEQYNKRIVEITKTKDKKLAELQLEAQRKTEDINKKGTERLAAIVEKSRERLRSAWQTGTQFSLSDLFAKTDKKSNILETLRNQLKTIKQFQLATMQLGNAGFSQTFIEEIVKAGPSAGMSMIAQIQKLSPLQQKELQGLYAELETLNEEGMDVLANTLSSSASLASKALTKEYATAQAEITEALQNINNELLINIAETNATYNDAFAEAKQTRDKALIEAQKEFNDAIAASNKDYYEGLSAAKATMDKAIGEATKALDKSLLDAQEAFNKSLTKAQEALNKTKETALKTFNKGLEDAQKALEKAITDAKATYDKGLLDAQTALAKAIMEAQNTYNKSIDEIDKQTQTKIDGLLAKLAQAAALLKSLGATQAAIDAKVTVPPTYLGGGAGGVMMEEQSYKAPSDVYNSNVTVQQNFTSVSADVSTITAATLSAISYGTAMVAI